MLEALGNLVRTLVVIAMVTAVLDMLLPESRFRQYLRLVVGMLVLLMVVNTFAGFLGREGRHSLSVMSYAGEKVEGVLEEGEALWEDNRQAILKEYRRRLREYLEGSLREEGWRLSRLEIQLQEEMEQENFGGILGVTALVYPLEEEEDHAVDPVEIPPVTLGENGEGGIEGETKTVPRLEEVVASRLGIGSDKVEVRKRVSR